MKIKEIEVTVNGETLTLTHETWSPSKAFSRLPKYGKAFITPLSMLAGLLGNGDEDEEGNSGKTLGETIPKIIWMAFEQMDTLDLWMMLEQATDSVMKDGKPINLDEDLGGDLAAIVSVASQALNQNYGSLWGKDLSSLVSTMAGMTGAYKAFSDQP